MYVEDISREASKRARAAVVEGKRGTRPKCSEPRSELLSDRRPTSRPMPMPSFPGLLIRHYQLLRNKVNGVSRIKTSYINHQLTAYK